MDMSVHYDKDLGSRGYDKVESSVLVLAHQCHHDKDALDAMEMRRTEFFRKGKHEESVFGGKRKPERAEKGRKRKKDYWTDEVEERIGSFEEHGRGVASKIMAK